MQKAAAVLAGLAGIGLSLAPAAAQAAPGGNRQPAVEFAGSFVVQDLCEFPVTIDAHVTGFEVTVETANGTIVRGRYNETDVFSANGVSLVGDYTFGAKYNFDEDGDIVKAVQTGIIVRVPLPDGDTFKVAGRADALAQQTDFIAAPTNGVTRNLDGFCAVLSGEG
jgi:hypothetical protein